MYKRILCVALALILLLSRLSYAHSGRTDGKGGHHDRIHGGYHYHHGYYAHDHPDGICPILEAEKLKNTNKESVGNSLKENSENNSSSPLLISGVLLLVFVVAPLVSIFLGKITNISKSKNIQDSAKADTREPKRYDRIEYLLRQRRIENVNSVSTIVYRYNSDNTGYVYRVRNSLCYHKFDCICLSRKTKYKISIEDAKKHGLSPCKKCKP